MLASLDDTHLNSKEIEDTKRADRPNHGQQNKRKDKYRTHNTTLKTTVGITRTLKKNRVSSGAPEG